MKAIIVALESEFPAELMDQLENKDDFNIYYTGVGKVNATILAMLAAANPECEAIINFGTAGALEEKYSGNLLRVGIVRQRDMDARPQADLGVTPFEETDFKGDIKISDSGIILGTGDSFVTSKPELESHLVDMEGYAIAKVAGVLNKPIYIMKYASDMADENAAADWEANQSKGAELFLKYLKENHG
jgi:adenosylhomocysteine nucleosidase